MRLRRMAVTPIEVNSKARLDAIPRFVVQTFSLPLSLLFHLSLTGGESNWNKVKIERGKLKFDAAVKRRFSAFWAL
jgi:hypothetical protein